jgi:hypothetical protein
MMLFALLAPIALLGVLLGMDRLERWTIDATEAPERAPSASTTDWSARQVNGRAGGRP